MSAEHAARTVKARLASAGSGNVYRQQATVVTTDPLTVKFSAAGPAVPARPGAFTLAADQDVEVLVGQGRPILVIDAY